MYINVFLMFDPFNCIAWSIDNPNLSLMLSFTLSELKIKHFQQCVAKVSFSTVFFSDSTQRNVLMFCFALLTLCLSVQQYQVNCRIVSTYTRDHTALWWL